MVLSSHTTHTNRWRFVVVFVVALALVWSAIDPRDRLTWILECFWVIDTRWSAFAGLTHIRTRPSSYSL